MERNEFNSILSDNKSGSEDLTLKLADYFEKYIEENQNPASEIKKAKTNLSEFAGVVNFLSTFERMIQTESISSVKKFLSSVKDEKTSLYRTIYENASPFLHNRRQILTLSNSKTILEILRLHHKKYSGLNVIVSESRPMLEGRIMAEKLAEDGITLNLITEPALPRYVEKCDMVLLGADKILSNGDIVNKTGSFNLALLCEYYQKPLLVAASRSKIVNNFIFEEDSKDPSEIWDTSHPNIRILNKYFEEVPARFITKLITD